MPSVWTQHAYGTRALMLAAYSFLAAASAAATTVTVNVYNFEFSTGPTSQAPVDAVIHVGDTIHWVWRSGFHSVKSLQGEVEEFYSGNFNSPHTFDWTYTHPGVHTYYCEVHGFDQGDGTAFGMVGTITVLPSALCDADFNADGLLDPDDLGDYINCYFSNPPCAKADFNHDGSVNPDDLGDYINAYFAGCR